MKAKSIFVLGVFFILPFLLKNLHAQTPLYFNIISHSEDSDPNNYENSIIEYTQVRDIAKRLCDTVISKNAKYNMQIDANFIFGCLNHENASVSSLDLLQWANNSPNIDVDGHNHFGVPSNPYNYSDLAHLLDSCGVVLERKILGGVTYADTIISPLTLQENWTQYSIPKAGYSFPNFFWQAEIVWGTATPGHVADYTRFGVWKPQGGTSPTEFGIHDPNATITHIGGGCKEEVSFILNQNNQLSHTTQEIIDNILQTADFIQTLPASSNDFYTMNMLVNFRDMPNVPGFVDSISIIIDGLQSYVNQGKIVWATLAEKYDMWYAAHTNLNDFFNYDCANIPLSVNEIHNVVSDFIMYPNPANTSIRIQINDSNDHVCRLYSSDGKLLHMEVIGSEKEFSISNYDKGIYLVQVDASAPKKLILE